MALAMQSDRHHTHSVDDPEEDRQSGRVTTIGRGDVVQRPRANSARPTRRQDLTLIVHLPVVPAIVLAPAAPRVAAEANLQVKRFHNGVAEDDRYTAALDAASDAPAALLAALADAATRIEDLVRAGAPDDHVIMTISIRR